MGFMTPKRPPVAAQLIAAPDNAEALREADAEARLRKRRAGVGAYVLTSPTGIPSTPQLGAVAPV